MTEPDSAERLLNRLRATLADAPAGLASTIEPLLHQISDRFQLVPKVEYERHVAQLATLEARIAELERLLRASAGSDDDSGDHAGDHTGD